MKCSLIAAVADNNVIGSDNKLLWHLPADMKFFKAKTTGHHLIMGRKTFESIGGGRPLPNRISIVITSQTDYQAPGCMIAHSLQHALNLVCNESEVFFIGGAQVYEQALPYVDTMYITRVHTSVSGDVSFPRVEMSDWQLIQSDFMTRDEKNPYDMTFERYTRKING